MSQVFKVNQSVMAYLPDGSGPYPATVISVDEANQVARVRLSGNSLQTYPVKFANLRQAGISSILPEQGIISKHFE